MVSGFLSNQAFKKDDFLAKVFFMRVYFGYPFLIKVNLENEGNHYSACSNLTNVVLVIVLGMIIGKGV